MNGDPHLVALVLYWAGIVVVLLTIGASMLFRQVYVRIHFLSPATSLGAPLIGLGLAVQDGWTLTTAEILFVCGLLAASGPVLEAATGKVAAEREGMVRQESPQ